MWIAATEIREADGVRVAAVVVSQMEIVDARSPQALMPAIVRCAIEGQPESLRGLLQAVSVEDAYSDPMRNETIVRVKLQPLRVRAQDPREKPLVRALNAALLEESIPAGKTRLIDLQE
jgi:hypothetical protein